MTLEVLSYHSSATTHDLAEVEQIQKVSTPINVRALAAYVVSPPPPQLSFSTFRFSYYGAELTDYGKIDKVVTMFNDLFGKERFEPATLVRQFLSLISIL